MGKVIRITSYISVPEGKENEITDAGRESLRVTMMMVMADAEGTEVEMIDGPIPESSKRPPPSPDAFDDNGMFKK